MNRLPRLLLVALLAVLLWPEFGRYHAERMLAEVNGQLNRILRGIDRGAEAQSAATQARETAHRAALLLPGDARPALLEAIALIMMRRGPEAIQVLDAAIAQGERPELTINLGRARGISGDEPGAMTAFLRTAWTNSGAVASLPAALRGRLLEQVNTLDAELQAGRLAAPPPLK